MSADFVANMEDVLDLHAEPHGPQRSVVCFDETSTQFLWESRPALPPQPGIPLRQDCEYRQEGARNLFLVCGPLAGWRQVAVTQRRTMQDFALQTRWLVDEAYPEAEMVRVVLDNLNTHRPASLYEIFPTEEARRIVRRLEFHYTPKHGSWLNSVLSTGQAMAEVELSALPPASAGGSPARRPSRGKSRSRPRSRSATPPRPPSIGGLTPGTPEPNFIIQTRLYPDPWKQPQTSVRASPLLDTPPGTIRIRIREMGTHMSLGCCRPPRQRRWFQLGRSDFPQWGRRAAAGCEGHGSYDDKKHEPQACSRRQLSSNKKIPPPPGSVPGGKRAFCIFGSGGWTRTNDLRVMSPTSCHCSTPRR